MMNHSEKLKKIKTEPGIQQRQKINGSLGFNFNGSIPLTLSAKLFVTHIFHSLLMKLIATEIVAAHGMAARFCLNYFQESAKDSTFTEPAIFKGIARRIAWPGYSLADNEFKTIEALMTYSPECGRKPTKVREMFDAILWILCSGAPWMDLPSQYPPYQSVYHRFRYYQKHDILEQVVETLLKKPVRIGRCS